MKRSNIYPHELIGEMVEITDSKNKSNLGIKGKIIDETKSTIKVELANSKIKTLMKNNITFKLLKSNEIIKGNEVARRPHERIK